MPLQLPLKKVFLTQKFGERPDVYRQFGLKGHNGWDFRTRFIDSPLGKMECRPISDGKVVSCGFDQGGFGYFCRIQHDDGSQTVYGHFSQLRVKLGHRVNQLTVIGITGNTGFSSGPHLHFGYRPPGWEKNANNGWRGYVDPKIIFPHV